MRVSPLWIFLIITATVIVYANSLSGPFVWDDIRLIQENPYIRNWSGLVDIFAKGTRGIAGPKSYFYRPFQILTFAVDYSLWKLDPRGYHATNLVLHIGTALCFFWLINILFKDVFLSFFASMLFVIHPVHTEAVAYISGRADPLAAVFLLLCFVLYIKNLDSGAIKSDIVISALYIIALLSRESAFILPFLLLLYHYAFSKKIIPGRLLPIAGITIVYILVRLFLLKGLLPHLDCPNTLFQRFPGFYVAITNYARLFLLPTDLHMEYGNKLFSFSNPQAILGIFIFAILVFLIFKLRRTGAVFTFSLGWFLIFLLPMSNLYPINAYMAEHWLYMPSLGFFLVLANALCSRRHCEERRRRDEAISERVHPEIASLTSFARNDGVAIVLFVALIVFYSFLTIRQNGYWSDPKRLYERTIKYAPDSSSSYNNLGIIYGDANDFVKAAALFEKAIQADPENAGAYNNLGKAYRAMGKNEDAIRYYEKSLEIEPGSAMSYYNIGNAYRDIGDNDRAIASFKKSVEIDFYFAKAHYNLGNLYYKMGKLQEAIASYANAIRADPGFAYAYGNLAVVYYDMRQYVLALECLRKAEALGARNDLLAEKLKPFIGK